MSLGKSSNNQEILQAEDERPNLIEEDTQIDYVEDQLKKAPVVFEESP